MDDSINVYPSKEQTAQKMAQYILSEINTIQKPAYIALSGGKTPEVLFDYLTREQADWNDIHFYWADERCVPIDHNESNYKSAQEHLFNPIGVLPHQIHRIKGENDPSYERWRYENEIQETVPSSGNLPAFDMILLGMGSDGHTASLFPGQPETLYSGRLCEVAVHPETQQRRITLTPRLINNSKQILFLVTGQEKAQSLKTIHREDAEKLPAGHIQSHYGATHWYIDQEAAQYLRES